MVDHRTSRTQIRNLLVVLLGLTTSGFRGSPLKKLVDGILFFFLQLLVLQMSSSTSIFCFSQQCSLFCFLLALCIFLIKILEFQKQLRSTVAIFFFKKPPSLSLGHFGNIGVIVWIVLGFFVGQNEIFVHIVHSLLFTSWRWSFSAIRTLFFFIVKRKCAFLYRGPGPRTSSGSASSSWFWRIVIVTIQIQVVVTIFHIILGVITGQIFVVFSFFFWFIVHWFHFTQVGLVIWRRRHVFIAGTGHNKVE
ncbi:hypothetical protein PGUG_03750 [Meyerozyma guilliermondii ATCC 6260]|uniref:Uncharacterized protein n=1 Tax=Meyerozyma guilliermondii (strain ATCC 6260 / CBS 566 / DSM 6381 / JCM 1539 / NBRC 10279 / NRRL Y-324) TaxID=294746 RepID=A5DKE9_PICGU|nr:uncharacterized protein PGUG_03750 [Meyerozyma guilliermondii ATCC 6260]EDK39651.2 hypothetical protein PGUG_03750 [Meyerozyma guilliermondii ATCC 6260]